jgi:hypothetical protein
MDLTRQRTIIFAALVIYQTIECLSVSTNTHIFSKKTFEVSHRKGFRGEEGLKQEEKKNKK